MTAPANNPQKPNARKPALKRWLKVIQATLAGALGVQSKRNYEEDFSSTSPWPYIAAGLLFGLGFILTLMLIVRWVLASQ
ncbi:MAG: DUF2970 domain-containing protein [Marinobacter sp.]|nr:DUF2970 domain-containing protein [Marinobacter sp.]